MPASADYVVRETASNLWRNRLMTFAAVLTVMVSLSLVGASLLLRQGAAVASFEWQRGTQVTVWMKPVPAPVAGAQRQADDKTATRQRIAVAEQLAQSPYVVQPCVFRGHQYDYREALHLDGDIIRESRIKPASIPTSFRCTPKSPVDASVSEVTRTFLGQPGVQRVTAPVKEIHTMERAISIISLGALIVAIALLVSAAVLILNTIRMAIFARRREVSVMKLVGATNWFIRVPFISEGMFQGLVGSGLAAAVVYGLDVVLDHLGNSQDPNSALAYMRLTGWQVFGTDAVVVLVGVVIGSVGSALAIRRFLDV